VILERYLDTFEQQAMRSPTAITARYSGVLARSLLERAYELLCTKHPVLRGRVRSDEHGHLLHVPTRSNPSIAVHGDGGGRSALASTAESWDITRAVAQLDLVPDQDGGVVALFTDHSVADGRSKHALFNELWAFCTDLSDGIDVRVEAGTVLPSPPSELFRRYLGGSATGNGTLPPEALSRRSFDARRRYMKWDARQTADLLGCARAEGTSINALICGAVAVAQRVEVNSDDAPLPMTCWAPVDYRDRVEPPVLPTAATNFGAPKEVPVLVAADEDPLEVGRRVKAGLDQALVELAPPEAQLARLFVQLNKAPERTLSKMSISNSGVVASLRQPASVSIVDWRVITYHIRQTYPIYTAHTYDGRLAIQFVYPSELFSDDEMARLESGIVARLEGLMRRVR
jgi:phenolphthiocerol/phthiocerol/phthiodiolone dimycocerosyl transferase